MAAVWQRKILNELCEITSSKRIYAADYQSEGVPFYRGKEVIEKQKGNLEVSTELFISESKFLEIRDRFGAPQPGELLLTSVGTLGVPYVIKPGEKFYFKDGNLTWFRHFRDLDSRFLYYWLLSPLGKAELKKCTIGSSQSAFTIVLLKGMEINLPPLPTQRKIAGILSAYDDLIENNTRRVKILEEMARTLYREWFVEFRIPNVELRMATPEEKKVTGKDVFPVAWNVGRLDDALLLQRGFDLPNKQRRDGNFPIYAATGIVGTHDEAKVKGPGVVTGRSGSLGTVIYVEEDYWPLNTSLWVKEFRRVTPLYAYYLLSDLELGQFNSGAAVPTLNRNDIHGLPIVIPGHEVLDKFDNCVLPLYALRRNLQERNTVLRRTHDLLLPRLVSGELEV